MKRNRHMRLCALLCYALVGVTASAHMNDTTNGTLPGAKPNFLLPVLLYGPGNQLAGFKEVAVGKTGRMTLAAC